MFQFVPKNIFQWSIPASTTTEVKPIEATWFTKWLQIGLLTASDADAQYAAQVACKSLPMYMVEKDCGTTILQENYFLQSLLLASTMVLGTQQLKGYCLEHFFWFLLQEANTECRKAGMSIEQSGHTV